jgi:hypothetical protein
MGAVRKLLAKLPHHLGGRTLIQHRDVKYAAMLCERRVYGLDRVIQPVSERMMISASYASSGGGDPALRRNGGVPASPGIGLQEDGWKCLHENRKIKPK